MHLNSGILETSKLMEEVTASAYKLVKCFAASASKPVGCIAVTSKMLTAKPMLVMIGQNVNDSTSMDK